MSDDRNLLVCNRVTPQRVNPPLAGALQRTCAFCASAVWVSLGSLATIAERAEPFAICCLECLPAHLPPGMELMPPSEAQIGEMQRELARRNAPTL